MSDKGSSLTCLKEVNDAARAFTVIGDGTDPHLVVPATTQIDQGAWCRGACAGHGPAVLICSCGTVRPSTKHCTPWYRSRSAHAAVIRQNRCYRAQIWELEADMDKGTQYTYPTLQHFFALCMKTIITDSPLTVRCVVDLLRLPRIQKHVQRRDRYHVQVARHQILHVLGGGREGGAQYLCTVAICDH